MGFLSALNLKGDKPKRSPGLSPTSPATANRIKHILGIQRLDSMPAQAAKAFQLASDPKAAASDFVDVIESDEALGARVVRIANSVYFFRGTPANDIAKAVANIGLNELRCLLSASMLRSLLQGKHKAREQVWANAVGTAIASRMLSRYIDNISEGEAFLSGLVHDVGKLIMIRRNGEGYQKVIQRVSPGTMSFIEAEEEIFELNHVEVGKWVAETWNFPVATIRAIAEHHQPWPTDEKLTGKRTSHGLLIKTADTIVHALGIGLPPVMSPFQKSKTAELSSAWKQIGMSTSDGGTFIETVRSQIDKEFAMYELDNVQ